MITYTQGNLLEAPVEALVNTVNTVGVMGKGIALMFKERFPLNMRAYALACKEKKVVIGKMFVTESNDLVGPRWIINFPTKEHWRDPSQMEWIEAGLQDLRHFLITNNVRSVAIPALGAGNGGLNWLDVQIKIEQALCDLHDIDIQVYKPTEQYQNIPKKSGIQNLTPARALIVEVIRRYLILGMECSILEIQKLAWFLQRVIEHNHLPNQLKLDFKANYYGPYADNLRLLLNTLDGSYLKSEKRIPDAGPYDVVWVNDSEKDKVIAYLKGDGRDYLPMLEQTTKLVDGFESPFGMELLATVDWLVTRENCDPELSSIKEGLNKWPAGTKWANRKMALFKDVHLQIAIERLRSMIY